MENQVLERKTIGEYRYEVFYDNFDDLNMDFENEKDKHDYLSKFQSGDLCSYGVIKSKVCECCCLWSEIDSLWGIHAEFPSQALMEYLQDRGEE